MTFFFKCSAHEMLEDMQDQSVQLILTDPPYNDIVNEPWDKMTSDELVSVFHAAHRVLTPTGSLVFFGGIGKHGSRMLLHVMLKLESEGLYTFRNWITWGKRRAYGKSHDYLFCREEILWYSKSAERTAVTFNIPLLNVKRGYKGWNENYPAKSEFKRVTNVWSDIPELMRPRRKCEKPLALAERLVLTHSNPDDLVFDPFMGLGPMLIAAAKYGRRIIGCDTDGAAIAIAVEDLSRVAQ